MTITTKPVESTLSTKTFPNQTQEKKNKMNKKEYKILKKINAEIAGDALDIKAIADCLENMDIPYPANYLAIFIRKKIIKIFRKIETNRKILKIKN